MIMAKNPVETIGKLCLSPIDWPLIYMRIGRRIPEVFLSCLLGELNSENKAYVENLKKQLAENNYNIEEHVAWAETRQA